VFPHLSDTEIPGRFKEIAEEGGFWHNEDIRYEGDRISNASDRYVFQTAPGEMASVFRDVTEQKLMEEEIRSLARFPSENTNPVLRISDDGIVMYANDASAPILEWWAAEVGSSIPEEWRTNISGAYGGGENQRKRNSRWGRQSCPSIYLP
jgi:PAS domain-containing protein